MDYSIFRFQKLKKTVLPALLWSGALGETGFSFPICWKCTVLDWRHATITTAEFRSTFT